LCGTIHRCNDEPQKNDTEYGAPKCPERATIVEVSSEVNAMNAFTKVVIVAVAALFVNTTPAMAYSQASSQAGSQAPRSLESLLPVDYFGYGYSPSNDVSFFWKPYDEEPVVETTVTGRILGYRNSDERDTGSASWNYPSAFRWQPWY
jgi:hypothetical protein